MPNKAFKTKTYIKEDSNDENIYVETVAGVSMIVVRNEVFAMG